MNKNHTPSLILFFLYHIGALAQLEVDWINSTGSGGLELSSTIEVDSNNNVFIGGHFRDNISFDPNSSNFDFTSGQFGDAFLQKFDENGGFLWAKVFLSDDANENPLIAIDDDDNIYFFSSFTGTIDLDPGPNEDIHTSTNNGDNAYIVKLNNNGDYLWGKSFENSSSNQSISGMDLIIDNDGNLVLIGKFQDTMDFDFSDSNFNMTSSGVDGFLLKINNEGSFVWAKQITGNLDQVIFSCITTDSQNNIISAGSFSSNNSGTGVTDFDPGSEVFNLSADYGFDLFILKLNEDGEFIWVKKVEESQSQAGRDKVNTITTDQSDNILFAGSFRNRINFEPNSTSFILDSGINGCDNCVGFQTGYFAKINENGDMLWAKKMEGDNFASGSSGETKHTDIVLKFNSNQELYLGYSFSGILDYSINNTNFSNGNSTTGNRMVFCQINPLDASFLVIHFVNSISKIGSMEYTNEGLYVSGQYSGSLFFDTETSIMSSPFNNVDNTCCSFDAFTVKFIPSSLDISDIVVEDKFEIYPTITENLIYFKHLELKEKYTISMFDITGKNQNMQIESNSIDLSSLSPGIYFVNYSSNEISITKRVIKK